MITLQHSLMTLLSVDGNIEQFKKEIAYALLPDGIRAITGPRQFSHFEKSEDGKESSWMKFPTNLKNFTKEKFEEVKKSLVENIRPCCMGEETDISAYVEHNQHLEPNYYNGILKHLIQDHHFDDFIRKVIDCTEKYEEKFYFNGRQMDAKENRALIAEIENHGFYILAMHLYQKHGITANQEWFDKNVKSVLDEIYPEGLSESTYKYMKIDERINELITNHDWSEIENGAVTKNMYEEMYSDMLEDMKQANYKKENKREVISYGGKTEVKKENTLDDILVQSTSKKETTINTPNIDKSR